MTGIETSIAISLGVSLLSAGVTYALTPTQKLQQGRLDSLTSPNANYGQAIPWAWGKVRLPGNRIWQDYLEENRNRENQGKGSKVETTNFNYHGYFASMFCDCPFRPVVDYQRIWMNKQLVMSKVGGAETIAEGGVFAEQYLRFYYGDPAQPIDPLLQHATPISNFNYGLPGDPTERDNFLISLGIDPATIALTPAYNRRAYMVAQRLPLQDFFKALPKTEAEIIASENCSVGQIIGDIMSLFYESDRYDVSLLTEPVTGFTIDSAGAAKTAIQTLQQAFFFDYVYSNGVYKFIPLNHERDVVNLKKEDLAAHTPGGKKPLDYEITEKDPVTLHSKIIVKYVDIDLNYDVQSQESGVEVKGHFNPNPLTMTFPIVMTGTQAATLADRILILEHLQSITYKFQLSPAHLDLEPADLVLNLFDDRAVPIKITKTRIGANLISDFEGVAHDTFFWNLIKVLEQGNITTGISDYNIAIAVKGDVIGVADTAGNVYQAGTDYKKADGAVSILDTGDIPPGINLLISTAINPVQPLADYGQIASPGNTELFVLNIPLITDSDDDYTLYLAAGGGENWNGASIYFSTDDSRYVFATSFSTYSIYGNTTTAIDDNGNLGVQVNKSELESITDSDLALGFNLALVGDEIIQFKTAQLTDTNTYILSELTRGLRGTTKANHVIGDRFVLLQGENAVLEKIVGSASDIGQTRYFKAVSPGQSLDQVSPVEITIQNLVQNQAATPAKSIHLLVESDRSLTQSDNEKILSCLSGTTLSLTLDPDLVYPGWQTTIRKKGDGNVRLNLAEDQVLEAVGDTITVKYAAIYLSYVGDNLWIAVGAFSQAS